MSSTRPIIPRTKPVPVPGGWEKNLRSAKPNMPCYRIAFSTSQLQGSTTFLLLPKFLSHKGKRITGTPKAASSFHRTWPNHSIYRFLLQPWYYTTADYSSHLVVTTTTALIFLLCSLFTNSASHRPAKGGDSGAATWTFSFRLEKIKINLTQTTTNRNILYIHENKQIFYIFMKILCSCCPTFKWNKTIFPSFIDSSGVALKDLKLLISSITM